MAETRTRRTQSAKSEQTEAENKAAEERKAEAEARKAEKDKEREEAKARRDAEKAERDEKRKAEKAERDAQREQEKEAKAKEREEAKAAKEAEKAQERQEKIDAGDLIFATFDRNLLNGDATEDDIQVTYTLAEPKKEEVARRALAVITDLQEQATEVPLPGKDLADTYGGGTVQWVAFFGMLRVLGMVKAYRFKTGERGESGLAYLWVGREEPYTLGEAEDLVEAGAEAE